jgi:hypothetical protein
MIQLVSYPVAGALQGGLSMVARPSSSEAQVPPAQVWSALSADVRTRVIALLAQLALYVVMARPPDEGTGKEASRACSTASDQNPS